MNSLYAEREIRPGESVSFDLDITHYYGDLPDGEYRVIYNTEAEGYYDFRIGKLPLTLP